MDISIILAQFWGSFFVIMGVLSVAARFLGKVIEMTGDKSFVVSTGYLSFMSGLATVVLHNMWVADWRVAITLLGWMTMLKGLMKMSFPEHINRQAQRFRKRQGLESVILAALGAWLLFMGFS